MLELKAVKVKKKNSLEVKSLATSIVYPSLLTNSFIFNPFFFILPNLLNNNTPIFFP